MNADFDEFYFSHNDGRQIVSTFKERQRKLSNNTFEPNNEKRKRGVGDRILKVFDILHKTDVFR